jgi:hypothetical protein
MMGPGMMVPGYGGQYGPQYEPQYQKPQKPMEEKDASGILENSLVDNILVDTLTGWMRSVYGT